VRLTASGIAVAVAAVGLALAGLVSAVLMSIAYAGAQEQRELRDREGTIARAEVVQVSMSSGESPRRIVTYAFEVDGRRYAGRSRLGRRDGRELRQGDPIDVMFVRSRPGTNWLTGSEPTGLPLWTIPLVSASLLAAAAAVAWGLRRQWILLAEGRPAQARVTGHKKTQSDSQLRAYRVSYEFAALSGARHTGRFEAGRKPPPAESTIAIVYHRDNPRRSAPYPFALVRPRRAPTRRHE